MANITAAMVKELRDKTGAGMMDCKAALAETDGNIEAAVDWLRKKGLSKAAKKAGRVAAEGLIAVESSGRTAAIVEVNAETDFVARNDAFQAFAREAAKIALMGDGTVGGLEAALPILFEALFHESRQPGRQVVADSRQRRRRIIADGVKIFQHLQLKPVIDRIVMKLSKQYDLCFGQHLNDLLILHSFPLFCK